ncbi:putative spermidine/putrescine transport system permease protein [Arthrobacter silviterrae]|uniref:ABC transporter permease subunit n=1 Tax=Arthrobacter silviterrae TaxID=2026658 RepID=A0ABX0DE11_9MICC|nr:ABC transporter permease subunit [Arthrobacter silviterrae]MDQ0278834.1 putative spermidine/putrescine transport system permease protein [Arthrobacter silviterrae]NGN84000.1 ABC transporter permease subunit [Arthrobacter silviterrae]
MAAPAVLVATFVVGGGMATSLAQSLGLFPLVGPPSLTVAAYAAQASELPAGIGLSLAIAAASTLVACLVGFTAALVIVQGRWCGKLVAALGTLTIPVPHIIGAASMSLLLADSGLLARLFNTGGGWPELVGGPWWIAVVAEYGWKESAFVALVVTGTLATRAVSYDETAALLGAGRLRRLRHVLIPLSMPALAVCATIVFVYSLGSYEVAWLLGRAYPEPLPVMALQLFNSATLTARPEAAAVAMVTTTLSFGAVAAAFAYLRRSTLWR